jgi:cytochrome c biogenesis protein
MYFDFKKKISTFFQSRKLAILLIILIILFSILGTHIPQKSQLKPDVYDKWKGNHTAEAEIYEKIGFTNIFSSIPFLGLALFLFLNTMFCTRTMFNNAFRRLEKKQFQNKTYISGLENNSSIRTEHGIEKVISETISTITSCGYKVFREENCLYAEKNRFGVIGTAFFHVCIIFIIVSSVYGSISRMEGDMQLIEGQALSEDHGNYKFINEGPFFNENHKKFNISLVKFDPEYIDESGTPRGPAGKLAIIENGQEMKTDMVYLNNLMTYGDYTFLGNVNGMAPLLVLRNPDGSVYSGSYIPATDLDGSGRYVTYFGLGDTGLDGGLMVYMTANLTSAKLSDPNVEKTPILFLKLFDNGTEIYDGTLRLGDTVRIYDKQTGIERTLVFSDVKYWSNFYVVKDNGTWLVYAGFGLMTLSLIILFFMIPKRLWIEVVNDENGDATVYIGGRADKFRSLYEEEYFSLVNIIKERLSLTK